MPSETNIQKLEELEDLLEKSKAVVLADYTGLSVKQQSNLRRQVKEAGGLFTVAKNRIFKLALKSKKLDFKELDQALKGPNSFLFAFEDEIAPLKALIEFEKENDLPKAKVGLLFKPTDKVLSLEEIQHLASLPTQQELVNKLIFTINFPRYGLVRVLSENHGKLIRVLHSIKKQKQSN